MPDPVTVQIVSTFDGAGTAQATAGLKSVEAEAAVAQQAVARTGSSSGAAWSPVPAISAQEAAVQAELNQQLAQQAALESEIQVIAQLRLNLAAATVLGEESLVSQIRQELAIRSATVGVMRNEVLSATELNALSERQVGLISAIKVEQEAAAVAATGVASGSLLAGVNINKARGEAITLARELGTGSVNARTLGAFIGSFGPAIAIGGVAGYVLFNAIKASAEEAEKLAKGITETNAKLAEQIASWHEVAAAAQTSADLERVGGEVLQGLDAQIRKLDELKAKGITTWQAIEDAIGKTFSAIPGHGEALNQEILDAARAAQQRNVDEAASGASAAIEAGQRAKSAYEGIDSAPLSQSISQLTEDLAAAKAAQEAIGHSTADEIKLWNQWQKEIDATQKHLDSLTKSQDQITASADKFREAIEKHNISNLAPQDQRVAFDKKAGQSQQGIREQGIEAASPEDAVNAALDKSNGLTKEAQAAVLEYAKAWEGAIEASEKVQENIDKQSVKDAKIAGDWQKLHDDTLRDLKEEIAIQQAKNSGQDDLAKKLENERDIRNEITKLMAQGLSYQEALSGAQALHPGPQAETPEQALDRTHADIVKSGRIDARSLRDRDVGGENITNRPRGLLGSHAIESEADFRSRFSKHVDLGPRHVVTGTGVSADFTNAFGPHVAGAVGGRGVHAGAEADLGKSGGSEKHLADAAKELRAAAQAIQRAWA